MERLSANRPATERIIRAFEEGLPDDLDSLVAEDYRDHQSIGETPVRGRGGFARVVDGARASLRDLRVSIEDYIEERDRVAVRLSWRGTAADGSSVVRETIDIIRFEKSRMVEHCGTEL
jgi:hypothetical protein